MHSHLVYPISHVLMIDPAVAEDSNTYERSAIKQSIRSKGTSPLSPEQSLDISVLLANGSALAVTTSIVEPDGCDTECAEN